MACHGIILTIRIILMMRMMPDFGSMIQFLVKMFQNTRLPEAMLHPDAMLEKIIMNIIAGGNALAPQGLGAQLKPFYPKLKCFNKMLLFLKCWAAGGSTTP